MSRRKLLNFRDSPVPYPGARIWRAAINSDVDGDSLWVERDTGCDQSQLIELRVIGASGPNVDGVMLPERGFDADERFTVGGKVVTAEVQRLCPVASVHLIETEIDTEKFGRWLSPVLIPMQSLPDDVVAHAPHGAFFGRRVWPDPDSLPDLYLDLASWLVFVYPTFARWKHYA